MSQFLHIMYFKIFKIKINFQNLFIVYNGFNIAHSDSFYEDSYSQLQNQDFLW